MNKYYYLVASLPTLKFGEEPPIERNAFIEECRKWLSEKDLAQLLPASIEYEDIGPEDIELIKRWKNFNTDYKMFIADMRIGKKFGKPHNVPDWVKHIFELENPLLIEKRIESLRWLVLEDNEVGYFFDINALIIYFLKLQILERLAKFDKDEGEKFFYSLCEINEAVIYEGQGTI